MVLEELTKIGERIQNIVKKGDIIPAIPLFAPNATPRSKSEKKENEKKEKGKWLDLRDFFISQKGRYKSFKTLMQKYNAYVITPEIFVQGLGYSQNITKEILKDLLPFYITRSKFKNINKQQLKISYNDALKIGYTYACLKFKSVYIKDKKKLIIILPVDVHDKIIESLLGSNYNSILSANIGNDNLPEIKYGYEYETLFFLLLWIINRMFILKTPLDELPTLTEGRWLICRVNPEGSKTIYEHTEIIYIPKEMTAFLAKIYGRFKNINKIQSCIKQAIKETKDGNEERDYILRNLFYKSILNRTYPFFNVLLIGLSKNYIDFLKAVKQKDYKKQKKINIAVKSLYRLLLIYYMEVLKDEKKIYYYLTRFGRELGKVARDKKEKGIFYELIMARTKEEFLKALERFCMKYNVPLKTKIKVRNSNNKDNKEIEKEITPLLTKVSDLDKLKAYILLGFISEFTKS